MLHGNGPYFTRPWGGTIIARRLQRILLDPHEAKILSALNNLQMGVCLRAPPNITTKQGDTPATCKYHPYQTPRSSLVRQYS
jgi:hypothetical protein